MWIVKNNNITMAQGDFGVGLTCNLKKVDIGSSDSIRFTIANYATESSIVTKEFTNITNNQIELTLTEADSNSLPVGVYLYSIDWYRNGLFMCNIIPFSKFMVVKKV